MMVIDSIEACNEFNECIADGSVSIIDQISEFRMLINYGTDQIELEVLPEYCSSIVFKPKLNLVPKSHIIVDDISWGIF